MAYTTINKPNLHFNTLTYTGDAVSPRTVTGVGFKPDFTWIKNRTRAGNTALNDNVRGVGTGVYKALSTEGTGAEGTNGESGYGYVNAYASDGFTLTTGSTAYDIVNRSGDSYVAWNWLGSGTTAVTNTQGTLTASVSANQTAGFSICRITEAGSYSGVQTFGHGLGVAPSMVIYRQANTGSNWQVYHKVTGTGLTQLNSTAGVNTSANFFPASTSTTFSLSENVQAPTYTSIAYCFADIKGFSKFGSYVGNANADGTFVYTGFKPAFILTKYISGEGINWNIKDTARERFNVTTQYLIPNLNIAEGGGSTWTMDILSNGFKIRTSDGLLNSSGTYIYAAFAEQPLVGTNNVPATAR